MEAGDSGRAEPRIRGAGEGTEPGARIRPACAVFQGAEGKRRPAGRGMKNAAPREGPRPVS